MVHEIDEDRLERAVLARLDRCDVGRCVPVAIGDVRISSGGAPGENVRSTSMSNRDEQGSATEVVSCIDIADYRDKDGHRVVRPGVLGSSNGGMGGCVSKVIPDAGDVLARLERSNHRAGMLKPAPR